MFNYPHYKEEDREMIMSFMRQHPFVMLIGTDARSRIEATQVPVMIDEQEDKIILRGHIARKSDHHRALEENPAALVIFTGAHTYISGTWYTGNLEQASTWNYIAIHARGKIRWMDEHELVTLLKKLTLHFENYNTASTTIYDNLPSAYVERLIKGIVGFEIEVTELDNVYKLSQKRDEKSYDNVVEQLKKMDGDAKEIGHIMEERKSKAFRS